MSVNLKQATYESLLSTYFHQTSAVAAAQKLDNLIQTNQRFTLDRLLRDHRIRGQSVPVGPESEGRAATDQLLKCCSALEIACQARVIPACIDADFAGQMARILSDASVRKYFEVFYPERNPQLFLLRLQGKAVDRGEADEAQCRSLFNRFIELDLRFMHDIESGPNALFLRLLDDWSWLYAGIGYKFDSIIKIISNPEDFVSIIATPVVSDDPRSSGIHGFVAFLTFATDLDSLLSDLAGYPMLQSCIWHHYGYWFDTISEDFDQKIGKAINSFLGWQPTAEMPLESSNRSSEALVEVIEEIKDFVRVTMQVLDRLIAPTFRKPVELALEAKMSSQSTLVTGPELLARVKELGDASKSDLVRAAGYISTKKDGTERLNFTAFYEALLEANGVSLGEGRAKDGGAPGRKLSYIVTVQSNGNLLIGKAYTAQLGLQPGDEFEIRIGKKEIHLVPVARKHPAGVPAVSTEFHASTSVSTKR
jgi:hypothetical protein